MSICEKSRLRYPPNLISTTGCPSKYALVTLRMTEAPNQFSLYFCMALFVDIDIKYHGNLPVLLACR